MKKTVWTFGLIAGAVLSGMMVLTIPLMPERLDFDKAEILGYTTIIAASLLIFFGVRSYRDNYAGRVITFGRAFLVGILINVVASACYVVTWQVVYRTVAPDFTEQYAAHALEKERAKGASEAELAAKKEQMARFAELYRNPLFNAAVTFLEPFAIGLVVALVTAGILRRRGDSSGSLGRPVAAEAITS